MLKPINSAAERIAAGRRHASRSIVITSLSAVSCFAFRREIIPAEDGKTRAETVWKGGMVLSEQDEHATEYVELGYAMMLFNKLLGGSIRSGGDDMNIGEAMLYAQIEPFHFEHYGSAANMLRNIPEWKPEKGDIFAMVISEDIVKWVECVGITGQSMHASHGETYVLNVRDSLMHLEPFKSHENVLVPAASIFPLQLSELNYSEKPIYNIDENDPALLSDDEITVRKFKLVNISDPKLVNYSSIIAIKHMAKQSGSPFILSASDAQNLTVEIGGGETFILSSIDAVRAVEANSEYITYMLMMTDHVSTVQKIESSLMAGQFVRVMSEGNIAFEVLPIHYDELRKAFHFVVKVSLSRQNNFSLNFEDGSEYPFSIDANEVEVTA
ncbi:hypothetical protein [Acinetobacter sp. ANC 3813]|uniref:hypothetical protein n=1 Tax=Acinetobacter sp. ANC 3813 TaxID=1977873 RepID=UPI000A3539CC|nr:hypothetical protein [Acinetobacter sp. ANC 3813]OTG87893.1 hypothetical protein B9T34_16290 [Acinetobacter sp. ANC 3813]